MKKRARNWHPEDIKAAIRKKDTTLTELALAYGLPECSVRYAMRHPHFDGEMAIADYLSLSPRQIWPSRFDSDGIRRHRRLRTERDSANTNRSHCLNAEAA